MPLMNQSDTPHLKRLAIVALGVLLVVAWFGRRSPHAPRLSNKATSDAVRFESRRAALSLIVADVTNFNITDPDAALEGLDSLWARMKEWRDQDEGDPHAALASAVNLEIEAARRALAECVAKGDVEVASVTKTMKQEAARVYEIVK